MSNGTITPEQAKAELQKRRQQVTHQQDVQSITPEMARSELDKRRHKERVRFIPKRFQKTPEEIAELKEMSVPAIVGRGAVRAAKETYREGVSPLLSGLSTTAFGLPKTIAKKYGVAEKIFPEQRTVGGKVLRVASEARGLFRGGAAGLSTKATKRIVGKGVKKAAQRGAVTGGIFGATQTYGDDPIDIKGRAIRSAGGALTGGVLGATFEIAGSLIGKGFRASSRAIRKMKGKAKPTIKEQIGKQIKTAKEARKTMEQQATTQLEADMVAASNEIDDAVLSYADDLQRSAEKGSSEFQKGQPKFARRGSKAYGKVLDKVSDDLSAQGTTLTRDEMNNVIVKTLNEADEALLPAGRGREIIEKLKEKYGSTQFISSLKKRTTSPKQFTLKEMWEDVKRVKRALSAGVKGGSSRMSEDEIIVQIFNKNWGELVATKAPALNNLNRQYVKVIQAVKKSNQIFKPFKGRFETKSGTQFLKRAAEGKLERGERELLKILEGGTTLEGEAIAGTGQLSKGTLEIGKKLGKLKAGKKGTLAGLRKAGEKKVAQQLQSFDNRLGQLAKRDETIAQLIRDKAKVAKIRKLIAAGVIGGAAAIKIIGGAKGSISKIIGEISSQ